MPFKRYHFFTFLLFTAGFGLFQQSAQAVLTYHDHLGFSLMPGANSQPVTYYIVRSYDDPAKHITAQNISKNEFISIAYGWGQSAANPNAENLFTKFEITQCGYMPDTMINHTLYKGGLGCSPLDDLWKLAYNDYPYGNTTVAPASTPGMVIKPATPTTGWARSPFKPSDGQIKILQSYGAEDFIDVIFGDNAFHLLHDMQDAVWVSKYSGS